MTGRAVHQNFEQGGSYFLFTEDEGYQQTL
jgi:hypothetical protein